MLQTSDDLRYRKLFSVTSCANRIFCQRNNVTYTDYIGIKVGCHPWHATFNRILLLMEFLGENYRGWVIYVDADAYVADLNFEIQGFLQQRQGRAILAA